MILASAVALFAALCGGTASALPTATSEPGTPTFAAAPMLLRGVDVPGLVTDPSASVGLSLWESAEREARQRAVLTRSGWRAGARRTFGQSPTSLYGVLVIESRVLVFATQSGARRALPRLSIAGLQHIGGRLPLAGGARVYEHQDTVAGVSELALATQFREGNVIARVMIVGTPGLITRAHLLATARRQLMRITGTQLGA